MAADLKTTLLCKIEEGHEVLQLCSSLDSVLGIVKLKKKIKAEINFLKKFEKTDAVLKHDHVKCSNLVHLKAVVLEALMQPGVVAVLQPFRLKDQTRVMVDIVADEGRTWVKVIARKGEALYQTSLGQGQFGEKSIVDHAEDFLSCALTHPVLYVPPVVKFVFCNNVPSMLAERLQELGIVVVGSRYQTVDVSSGSLNKDKSMFDAKPRQPESNDLSTDAESGCSDSILQTPSGVSLNLDVTTLLAYVSSLTNGNCWLRFHEAVLTYQAERERKFPVKPILDSLFEGRKLICCATAARDFDNIVSTLGGPNERVRAQQLMSRVKVVEDEVSERASFLQLSAQIKSRSKIIFGTGDTFQAVTVTANVGFVRGAESQGVKLAVFVHESRALTEAKEKSAQIVKCDAESFQT